MRNTTSNNPLGSLAEAAMVIASRGAHEYMARNNFRCQHEQLAEALLHWVKAKLPEALKDAKQALDCRMFQIAEATFAATMIDAGVKAAIQASAPIESQPFPLGRWQSLTLNTKTNMPFNYRHITLNNGLRLCVEFKSTAFGKSDYKITDRNGLGGRITVCHDETIHPSLEPFAYENDARKAQQWFQDYGFCFSDACDALRAARAQYFDECAADIIRLNLLSYADKWTEARAKELIAQGAV